MPGVLPYVQRIGVADGQEEEQEKVDHSSSNNGCKSCSVVSCVEGNIAWNIQY